MMKKIPCLLGLLPALALVLLAGCGGDSNPKSVALLSADNINLIFVVTPDLANDPLGDINPDTANLSNKGLQRSLLMATYLKQQLLGTNNVTAIYTLEPMTHPQTANKYPDMAPIGFIQQFALLNRKTMLGTTADSFPINAAYAPGDAPSEVATPNPYVHGAQGLAFRDTHGNNAALATRIINANSPGFHVFSAPWETTSALLASIKAAKGYNITLPGTYQGPNFVYVISITPSGNARLATFDSKLNPPGAYPLLPSPVAGCPCTQQKFFSYTRAGGMNGAVIPAGINTNQTVYLIRHAEAHPSRTFEDGNFVGAGQWRALSLPNFLPGALRGRPIPTMVYSVDPAQSFPLVNVSYVRPSLTVLPYAIANNVPYNLAASFLMNPDADSASAAENAKNFFFMNSAGVNLSNQTILLAWEHKHLPPLVQHLINSYGGTTPVPTLTWPDADYDTIWTVRLDAMGNLTVDNALCQGIDSSKLPAAAPQY